MCEVDFSELVAASARRLKEARGLADTVRQDERIHRLAMKAVFVLEDCHEALQRLQKNAREQEG